jgi:hypothetical protein
MIDRFGTNNKRVTVFVIPWKEVFSAIYERMTVRGSLLNLVRGDLRQRKKDVNAYRQDVWPRQ